MFEVQGSQDAVFPRDIAGKGLVRECVRFDACSAKASSGRAVWRRRPERGRIGKGILSSRIGSAIYSAKATTLGAKNILTFFLGWSLFRLRTLERFA